jgi:hypothetical protein
MEFGEPEQGIRLVGQCTGVALRTRRTDRVLRGNSAHDGGLANDKVAGEVGRTAMAQSIATYVDAKLDGANLGI